MSGVEPGLGSGLLARNWASAHCPVAWRWPDAVTSFAQSQGGPRGGSQLTRGPAAAEHNPLGTRGGKCGPGLFWEPRCPQLRGHLSLFCPVSHRAAWVGRRAPGDKGTQRAGGTLGGGDRSLAALRCERVTRPGTRGPGTGLTPSCPLTPVPSQVASARTGAWGAAALPPSGRGHHHCVRSRWFVGGRGLGVRFMEIWGL